MELSQLSGALDEPLMDSMNFLNEVALRYPDAISFAAGRPSEEFFASDDLARYLGEYRTFLAGRGLDEPAIVRTLFQYGRTKGVIHELIARHLQVDEGIEADPDAIVVTVGAQEAMYLVLRALCRNDRDVALAVSPFYVGFAGAAKMVGMPVLPVDSGDRGVDLGHLREQLHNARKSALRPRCLYLVPDFANPTGMSLDLGTRRELLDLAEAENLLVVEDNPYGIFGGEDEPLPTLKALDENGHVLYVGSFAKTALPGARVGYAVADQSVAGRSGYLADELAKIKSMVTVNTSPVSQALVAGRLLESAFSLREANAELAGRYRRNRELVLAGLAERFTGTPGVSWNRPAGGFFVSVSVPFPVDDALLEHSAREHKVLWTPMSHFYADATGGTHQLRLSCSFLSTSDIHEGLDRLAGLVAEQAAVPAA